MHELSICRSVIDLINAEARDKGFETVLEISLRVGEFSGLAPDCIREFFYSLYYISIDHKLTII